MADQAAKTRADAIEAFAAALRGLRESVGNPSFREMSGRSRAISHTTLHEAAQGYRLPSWATTAEFVKACGADPADYRARWEHADRLIRSASSPRLPAPTSDAESGPSAGIAIPATGGTVRRAIQVAIGRESAAPRAPLAAPVVAVDDGGAAAPSGRRRPRLRSVLAGAAVVSVLAVATLVVVLTVGPGHHSPPGNHNALRPPSRMLSPADCPVHQLNPPFVPAAHPGDASAFVADLTLPDCSHIRRGQTALKVWRLKNVGKVPWTGYSLHRLDSPQQRDECQTITDVPVDDTLPGHVVDIRTEITAPKRPGFCLARFKMVDASGRIAFPGTRPVNFQLIVD